MPLFSNCFDICLAKELSSMPRKSNGIIPSDENKKSTKKHSQKKNKREHKEHKQRDKKKEGHKFTKSKGDHNRSNKNKHNLTYKKNNHKRETSVNQEEYINQQSLCQINTINKMKSLTNNKQKESVVLVDEQWNVSNCQDNKNVLLDKVQIMHTVSIFNCSNSTIVIDAEKFKSLQIQNCSKCNILLKNLISAIEMIDSKKIKVQITGRCASVTIDKCIGVEIYLSKENEETEFTTALSAEMNVHVEGINPDDDWKEITIPEQYQHVLNKGDLTTRVSDLYKF